MCEFIRHLILKVLIRVSCQTQKNGKGPLPNHLPRRMLYRGMWVSTECKPITFLGSYSKGYFTGFFSYKNKKYGQFYLAVQTFTKKVFAVSIPNLKTDSFIRAIQSMLKVQKKSPHNVTP